MYTHEEPLLDHSVSSHSDDETPPQASGYTFIGLESSVNKPTKKHETPTNPGDPSSPSQLSSYSVLGQENLSGSRQPVKEDAQWSDSKQDSSCSDSTDDKGKEHTSSDTESESSTAKETETPRFIGVTYLPQGSVTHSTKLGQGAFGQVFRGSWQGRDVALKTINLKHAQKNFPDMTPAQIQETLQWEVSRLSTVNHPHCVQFYGMYQDKKNLYLTMEFCHGGTLEGVLKSSQEVSWANRWAWAWEISQGLAYLVDQGVLHRDLKAENILLDERGCAKLADLGVAQVDALLQKGEAGVVAKGLQDNRFIAPEQLTHPLASSKETDIYALGLVFWQLASRKVPRHPNTMSLSEQQQWKDGHDGYVRETIPDDCPAAFQDLILACWQTDPTRRPPIETITHTLSKMGRVLHHPNPARLQACDKIDALIHPKRLEGLRYLEPYLTAHQVNEPIEVYWGRFESSGQQNSGNPPLNLTQTLNDFLKDPKSVTLLLLGDAGLGKTLSTTLLADRLLSVWRRHGQDPDSTPQPAYFPLFIRPALKTWSHKALKGGYDKALTYYGLQGQTLPFLLIVDGYDECQTNPTFDRHPLNLLKQLKIPVDSEVKVLITCRPDTVAAIDLNARFGFYQRLDVRYFLPFKLEQLIQYLETSLGWQSDDKARYQVKLTGSAQLRTVLRNPFVLTVMADSWPTVLAHHPELKGLNRWKIYEAAVAHAMITHEDLLAKPLQQRLMDSHVSLLASFQTFASELALTAFQEKTFTLPQEKIKKLTSSWGSLDTHLRQTSQATFVKRQAKLTEYGKRRALLSEGDYLHVMQGRLAQFSAGLPLKRQSHQYEYRHKSFFEYFLAKYIVSLRDKQKGDVLKEGIHCLLTRALQEEPDMLRFWAEAWQEPKTQTLTELLFDIVVSSRDDPSLAQAASNAATLLAVARVPFSGQDLSRVRIPGAYLAGGVFDHTAFRGADLTGVVLKACYLNHTDFREAQLNETRFGAYPTYPVKAAVRCVSYSPDGRQMALGAGKLILRYDDQEKTGTLERQLPLKGHTDLVTSVAYRSDSGQLASSSQDLTLRIWEVTSGQCVKILKGHTGPVTGVTYLDKTILSSAEDRTLRHWDPSSGRSLTLFRGHTHKVWAVLCRPDGQQWASASEDTQIRLWNLTSSKSLRVLQGHTGPVFTITYRADSQQLASGSADKTVKLWDPQTGQSVGVLHGHTDKIWSVAYRPENQQLASSSDDNTVRLWDTASLQCLMVLQGHQNTVRSVAYRPDGQQLASGSDDKTVRIWDATSQILTNLQEEGHTEDVMAVAFSPDGHYIASGSKDKTLRIWDGTSAQWVLTLEGHTAQINAVAYHPQGQHLVASGSDDKTLRLWDVKSAHCIAVLHGHSGAVRSVTYRPDGQQLASGGDRTVRLWDIPSGKGCLKLEGHQGIVRSVAFRPNSQQLASGSEDKTIRLWDLTSGQTVAILKGHTHWVKSVVYQPDGHYLASGSFDRTIRLWHVESGQCLKPLQGHKNSVMSVAYRLDGQQLASSANDHTVRLWDLTSNQGCLILKGHTQSVTSIAYRSDGQQLASGSLDHAVYLWSKAFTVSTSKGETWTLTYRLTSSLALVAKHAYLSQAQLASTDRTLLMQGGATEDTLLKTTYFPRASMASSRLFGQFFSVNQEEEPHDGGLCISRYLRPKETQVLACVNQQCHRFFKQALPLSLRSREAEEGLPQKDTPIQEEARCIVS